MFAPVPLLDSSPPSPDDLAEQSSVATPAVVLGLGINGLGVVRALGRAGIPAVGLYSTDDQAGSFSRYCRAVRAPAHPCAETLRVLQAAMGGETRKAVLLPTSDAYAQWLNDHQETLRPRFRFQTIEPRLFERLNSKIGAARLAAQHGLETPATGHFDHLEEFERGIGALRFPILLKPVDTFRRTLPDRRKNVLFTDAPALLAYVRPCAGRLPDLVFQEVVPSGDGHIHVCTLLLDERGEVVLSYTGRKIRQYRPDFGVTCFGVSERDEGLAALAARFLRAVGYRGLCTLEFARHRETGRYVFLEANLRSYYHNQLFYDCGVNFPSTQYRLLTGGALPPNRTQKDGVYWLDFARDAGAFRRKHSAHQIGAFAWLRSLLRARSFAAFALDDPLPWIYETGQLLRRTWRVATSLRRNHPRSWR
jgi:predicted ATP-grasp superfamily ATP-dependent carboligase